MRSLSSNVLSTSTRKTVWSGMIIENTRVGAGSAQPVDGKFDHHLRSVQVMRVVPEPDSRLGKVVLVAEQAEARGAEQEIAPAGGVEAEPAGGEHAQDMRAR